MKIPEAFEELKTRAKEIVQPIDPRRIFGLFKVDAQPSEDGYWVCLQVEEIENVADGLEGLSIDSSKYATHVGSPKDLHQAYANLHEEIAEAGYRRVPAKWSIEEYSPDNEQSRHIINVLLHDPVA
ncbi:GyrI-like domain-containing protein [Sporosarcina sp. ACRSL]|uniref:GyrI-like domain-containing protein n=1 Tax=Sporosarcina sp. ACRSL TaxID=2918215 RepID=UPI001EF4D235|nr:GyrI-like domain-containing protein [Sporosarcina sp. ACRSL]